jgi:hypothetical protein
VHASSSERFGPQIPCSHARIPVSPSPHRCRKTLKYLADVRNGVVHAGHLISKAQDRVLLPFITACDLLLDDMEASRDDFWGEYVELVDTHRAESAKAAEVEAAEAITLARMAFAERRILAVIATAGLRSLRSAWRT